MMFCFRLKQKHKKKKKEKKKKKKKKESERCTKTETANPSSEKMTTVARVIGLKGMPMGKTLVGSFSQPRDHRLPKEKK